MNKPIKLSKSLSALKGCRNNGWTMTETYLGKDKNGNQTTREHEYYYGTFKSCVQKALDIEIGTCGSLAEIADLLDKFTESIKDQNKP